LKRGSLVMGGTLVATLALAAFVTPWLPLADPLRQDLAGEFARASWAHPLGQGENGVDLLAQVLWGARISLGIGVGSVMISALIGLVLGSLAGFQRGWVDMVIMRIVDTIYAFPGILLVVGLSAVLGPSLRNVFLVLVLTSWAGYARLARGLSLALREREHVQAARALGASLPRILVRHVWPNLLPSLLVQMTFGLGSAILTESSLSFLGLGAPAGTPTWGQLLNQSREVITTAVHVALVPGGLLVATILGLNLLGDGLRDLLDPKFRQGI
jgi:peptide/nickel transport system permease protein